MAEVVNGGRKLANQGGLGEQFVGAAESWEHWRGDGHPEWRLQHFLDSCRKLAEALARSQISKEMWAGRRVAGPVPDSGPIEESTNEHAAVSDGGADQQ
jgi:hypothetical protein